MEQMVRAVAVALAVHSRLAIPLLLAVPVVPMVAVAVAHPLPTILRRMAVLALLDGH
jgi:hypothetical protein